LKKQTQFAAGQIGLNYYMKGIYDNILTCGLRKNKANQSQFTYGARDCRGPSWLEMTHLLCF
jgi:hypothetical protein